MSSASTEESELIQLITQLLNPDVSRRNSDTRTHSSRFRQRSSASDTITTNAILEIVRGYTSNINEYNRNMNRVLQLMESDLYHRMSERTRVDDPYRPTPIRRPNPSRDIPSRNHTDFSFWINAFPLYRMATAVEPGATGLTPEQINSATREITYRSAEFTDNRVCPISLEDFAEGETILQLRECNHVFKPAELSRWLEHHDCCPLCRRNVHTNTVADTPPPLLESDAELPVSSNRTGYNPEFIEYPLLYTDLSGNRLW